MKKIIALSIITATSLMAMYAEQAYIYKDARIMGAGGANVAVGGYSTSVFANPAGLASIKKEHGFVVDLLGVGVSATAKIGEFMQDLQDASDTGNDSEVTKVLEKYSGEPFHVGVDNYTSISKNSDAFAWSIGFLAAADVNLMAHANGSTAGGLLETSSRAYGGLVFGVAKPYDTEYGRVDVGVGVKYISQNSYEGALGVTELTDQTDDLGKKLQDKYEKQSSGFGVDIGVAYKPLPDSFWNPTFGMSILNIGSMGMDDNYGAQPMTVNAGVALHPDVSFMNKMTLAVDYVDIFNANKLRMYNYSSSGAVTFSEYTDSDMMKRLRLGANFGLIDTSVFSLALSGGLYQGAYTAGADLELFILKLNFATYEEQLGTGSVDIADRRYMAKLGIGW